MFLVSGGYNPGSGGYYLDSTEIFDAELGSANWRAVAALPSPRVGPTAVNIDNRVLIFGIR